MVGGKHSLEREEKDDLKVLKVLKVLKNYLMRRLFV